jgi:hypothetical protein
VLPRPRNDRRRNEVVRDWHIVRSSVKLRNTNPFVVEDTCVSGRDQSHSRRQVHMLDVLERSAVTQSRFWFETEVQ